MTPHSQRPMAQFEVIPTRSGWRLVEWRWCQFGTNYQPQHIKFMDWPALRSMTSINRQTP